MIESLFKLSLDIILFVLVFSLFIIAVGLLCFVGYVISLIVRCGYYELIGNEEMFEKMFEKFSDIFP